MNELNLVTLCFAETNIRTWFVFDVPLLRILVANRNPILHGTLQDIYLARSHYPFSGGYFCHRLFSAASSP